MAEMAPMEEVITDAVEDTYSTDTDTTQVETTPDAGTEAAPNEAATAGTQDATETSNQEALDAFSKQYGVSAQSPLGRENRIPYSRVKKIVEKAKADEAARLAKEYEGKLGPATEAQTKLQDYESRLQRVAQFEQILENDPQTFLDLLSKIPAYQPFFNYVAQLANGQPSAAAGQPAQQPYLDHSDMPQPDQTLSDGSKVYSLEGLAKRDEWLARKIEQKAVAQAEERLSQRYQPIEQHWQEQQRIQQAIPQIERQIATARQWDKFADLEPRVIELLKADRSVSLEGAYIRAYQEFVAKERETLTTDRNKVRAGVLDEIRRTPVSTNQAPVSPVRAVPQNQGPRTTEEIIMDAIKNHPDR